MSSSSTPGSVDLSGSKVEVVTETLAVTDIDSYPKSHSLQFDTREGGVRKKIFTMTRSQNNISFVYKNLLRAMIASFNDVGYISSEDKFLYVKCIHANAERAVAKLKQDNNIILPIISIAQTISDNDDTRRRSESILVHEKFWDVEKNRAIRVLSLAPRAVNIHYQVNIWTKYMADMDQILEQIRIKFNPEMEVPTQQGTLTKGLIESEEDVGQITVADKEDRVLKKTINITVRTYVPNPKFLVTSTGKIEKFKINIP